MTTFDLQELANQYEHGIEAVQCLEGWAVFGGSEGEDPYLVAFFSREEIAVTYVEAKDAHGDELVFDGSVNLAIVMGDTIIAANDFELSTHEKLRARVQEWLSAPRSERKYSLISRGTNDGNVEFAHIDSEDVVTIGSPQTPPFAMKVYVGGQLLEPVEGCICGSCRLLRTIPKAKS